MNHVVAQFFGSPCCMSCLWVKIVNLRMLPYKQVWHHLYYEWLWRQMQSQSALAEIQRILLMFCLWIWWFCLGSSGGQCMHQSKQTLYRAFVYTWIYCPPQCHTWRVWWKANMFDLLCKTHFTHMSGLWQYRFNKNNNKPFAFSWPLTICRPKKHFLLSLGFTIDVNACLY